jgi:hypothetical protein
MNDSVFRFLLAALLVAFFVVRAHHHRTAALEGGKIEYREKNLKLLWAIRLGLFLIFLPAFIAWLIQPRWIAFAARPSRPGCAGPVMLASLTCPCCGGSRRHWARTSTPPCTFARNIPW